MKSLNTDSINIILGSQSPRRKQLLEQLDLTFETRVSDMDEVFPEGLQSNEVARYLAVQKGGTYLKDLSERDLLITADTLVILGNKILGKPKDRDEAVKMLEALSGKSHFVITGVAFTTIAKTHSFSEKTRVTFKKLSKDEISYYIDKYEPYDKAGSYGIQEWIGLIAVSEIQGCFFNVMGLPVPRLYNELQNFIN